MLAILVLIAFVLITIAVLVAIGYVLGSRFVRRKSSIAQLDNGQESLPPVSHPR